MIKIRIRVVRIRMRGWSQLKILRIWNTALNNFFGTVTISDLDPDPNDKTDVKIRKCNHLYKL